MKSVMDIASNTTPQMENIILTNFRRMGMSLNNIVQLFFNGVKILANLSSFELIVNPAARDASRFT
jgi:hypothetical protein